MAEDIKHDDKKETKVEEKKLEAAKVEEKKVEDKETKHEEKKETKVDKKPIKVEIKKKELAIVNGISLAISPKHCFSICKMINGKTPDRAIEMLENVVKHKIAVPMANREVPHRHGDIMAGRYPRNASLEMIILLKQLKANCSVNGIDNPVIVIAKANKASRPFKRGGRKAKRAHVYLEAKEINSVGKKLNREVKQTKKPTEEKKLVKEEKKETKVEDKK